MHVLVTGHLGYIGSVLTPMLVSRGHEVVGCDVGFFSECLYLTNDVKVPNIKKDIRDLQPEDLQGIDAIIHLAGLSNDQMGDIDPNLTIAINQFAAVQLAENARSSGVQRFLFASTCSNYGLSDGELLNEASSFSPVTPYGKAKSNADIKISELKNENFSPTNLRAGTVYGIAPAMRFDLVLNNLIAHAISTNSILLKSDGSAWRPLVHVSDLALAYVCILEAEPQKVSGESFNVGATNQNFKIIELAHKIEEYLPDCQIRITPSANSDQRNYRVNCDKISTTVKSFAPEWSVDRGIVELVTTLREFPVEKSEFEGHKFNRLPHLLHLIETRRIDNHLRYQMD